jgi:hypothetical protein
VSSVALAVLDERQLGGRAADRRAELVERHDLGRRRMPPALPEGHEVDGSSESEAVTVSR